MSKVLLMVMGFGSSLLLPLVLDQTEVGRFFIAQIVIAGLSIVAQLGLTLSIPAIVTAAVAVGDFGRARQSVIQISLVSLFAALLTSAVTFALLSPFLDFLGSEHTGDWLLILPVIAGMVPFTCQTAILTELLRALHSYKASANLSAVAGSFTVFYLIIALSTGNGTSLRNILVAGLVGSAICTMVGAALVMREINRWPRTAFFPFSLRATIRATLPNLFSSLVLFGLAQFDILLLSLFWGTHEVAVYGIALRFSGLLVIPLAIANAALAPIAMELRTLGRLEDLQRILRRVAGSCALLAILAYLGFAALGQGLISKWNPEYGSAYQLMLILGLGQIFHVSCGAAGMLLMTGGDQLMAMRITLVTGLITVLLCLVGLYLAGTLGLAVGAALGNLLQVMCFTWRVRFRFALEPSLFGFLRPVQRFGAGQ